MHLSAKPVRKCHGCGLNLGESCGVYANPRLVWQRHTTCPGFMNEQLLADYQASLAHKEDKVRKEKRRMLARLRQQEAPHYNGDRHVLIAAQH